MTVANVTPPVISGTTVQGNALHSTPGTWTSTDPLSYAYQWERCDGAGANCVDIANAIASSYILGAADVGHTIRVRVTATENVPPPPPPPPPPGTWLSPINITVGGTYTGNWRSTSATGPNAYGAAVQISTSQPVIIEDSVIENTTATGYCTYSNTAGNNITFRRCRFITPWAGTAGRALNTGSSAQITVENCSISGTSGFYIQGPQAGSSLYFAKNDVLNIQDVVGNNAVFFQVNGGVSMASCIIEWNQIINNYGQSLVEDTISIYNSNGCVVRNNYIQGGYPATPSSAASGMGINLGDDGGSNNSAHDNQIVAYTNGGIGLVSGSNNHAYDNRVVADGRLDDGTQMAWSNVGLICYTTTPGNNNTFTGNYVGWMQGTGFGHPISRVDYYCPTADNNVEADNTWAYGDHSTPMTHSDELAEWPIWQAKLVANGITLGA